MAHRVAWSQRAIEDLKAIAQFIPADSSAYAATVVKTILNATRNPARFRFAVFDYSYDGLMSSRGSSRVRFKYDLVNLSSTTEICFFSSLLEVMLIIVPIKKALRL